MAIPPAEKARLDDLMLISFQQIRFPFINSVLSFWPLEERNEVNTRIFTDYLRFRNPEIRILYPKSDFTRNEMEAILVGQETRFVRTEKNLYEPESGTAMEPQEIDMVLVPMLIFDEQGYRVGYGRGFYDKFLAKCDPDAVKVGMSYFEPIERIEDHDDFDIPLNYCITPHNTYAF